MKRGEYRGLYLALLDDPEFQTLSPHARLLLIVTRLMTGPSAIDVVPAFDATACERTGLSLQEMGAAFDELSARPWLRRQGNVLWVVNGLRFEPCLNSENGKHRTGVQRHVASLPRLAIVGTFIRYYSDWFPDAESLANGYPMGIDSHPIAMPSREKGEGKREKGKGRRDLVAADAPTPPASWVQRLHAVYLEHKGHVAHGRIGRALKPVVDLHGEALVAAAAEQQLKCRKIEGKLAFATPEKLAEEITEWIEATKPISFYTESGEANPQALALLGLKPPT